jgi:hypothetical protein
MANRAVRTSVRRCAWMAVCGLFVAAAPAFGRHPTSDILNTAAFTAAADLVVSGRVAHVAPTGRTRSVDVAFNQPENLEVYEATFDIALVLKGSPPSRRMTFEFLGAPSDSRGTVSGAYRIFFLVRRDNGFAVVDNSFPSVAAAPDATFPPEDVEPIDRVVDLVAPTLVAPTSTRAQKLETLWTLASSHGPRAVEFLRRGVADPDDDIWQRALGMLLALHDTSRLALAEDVLMRPERHTSNAALDVRAGLETGLNDPAAVPMLSRLMKSPDALTRRTAATLLFQVKSPDGVPALVGGLDDDDPEVRRMSTVGLSAITGEKPSIRLRGDSEAIENYWRAWARQRGLLP